MTPDVSAIHRDHSYYETSRALDNPSKEDETLTAMWSDALGFSGNMNEFTGQIFLDPLNFVPAAVNKSVDIYATKKFNLATAADDLVSAKKYANLSALQGVVIPY